MGSTRKGEQGEPGPPGQEGPQGAGFETCDNIEQAGEDIAAVRPDWSTAYLQLPQDLKTSQVKLPVK
jgi:hypothetical protein